MPPLTAQQKRECPKYGKCRTPLTCHELGKCRATEPKGEFELGLDIVEDILRKDDK